MGVFGDWAEQYYESGLYVMPCGVFKDKAPPFKDWTEFCEVAPDEHVFMSWVDKYKDANQIGLLLGKSTGKVAFDFDYAYDHKKVKISEEEFFADKLKVEKEILELLPLSIVGKIGAKGWTRFYKWNPSLENKKCDRNGVRLFDFLCSGRQTIIPPSVHSRKEDGSQIIYKWMDESLDQVKDLPSISMDVIDTIVSQYQDRSYAGRPNLSDMSRHERVMFFILDALRVDDDINRIAMSAIKYDVLVNEKQFKQKPYFLDTVHNKSKDPVENAKSFVLKLKKWSDKKRSLAESEEKKELDKPTNQAWNHFFEISFDQLKKDVFTEDVFVKSHTKKMWENIWNFENVLKSYARAKKIPKTHVPEELSRFIYEKKDVEFLCDIPKWDGRDRIKEILSCVKSTDFTADEISDIFKNWGVIMFSRLYDSSVQNRCIILKGNQGIGKDTLVRALMGDFKPYYDSTTLPGTPKDVLEIVSRLLICHIEEFDQTKHLDVGFIKSLITQPTSYFREAYGHSPSQKLMRASFITTANIDDIFRDPTGNRRFIVVSIDKIRHEYSRSDSLQVIAQWKHLFDKGECCYLTKELEAKIKEVIDKMTPTSIEDVIVDLYLSRMENLIGRVDARYGFRENLNSTEIIEVLSDIAKKAGVGIKRVQSAIKFKKYSAHTREGTKYYKTPQK
jgi:hypothetical protein